MLYSQIRRETLGHLNRYSVAGSPIAPSYNNQSDDLIRIPQFINEALVNIRTFVKPLPAACVLEESEKWNGLRAFALPRDFRALKSGGVAVVGGGRVEKTNRFHLQGRRLLLPAGAGEALSVEYWAYPPQLPADPAEDFDLDEDLEVVQAAICYAAAQLALQDDDGVYALLYNDYESRLSRMALPAAAAGGCVEDVYGFAGGGAV